MDDFQAWQNIHDEWRQVRRMKKLNQELYDLLGDVLRYYIRYGEKNGILFPDKNKIQEVLDKIHGITHEINKPLLSNYGI